MSKRFAWLLGVVMLVAIGLLVACGNNYNSSNDGLVLVGSQGSGLIQTYTFGLSNGQISSIANPTSDTSQEVCVLNGIPSSIVLDPAGAYAYVIINENSACPGSANGIGAFKVNSDGTLTAVGSLIPDPNPVALIMDSSGKFLFVAEGLYLTPTTLNPNLPLPCPGTTQYGICSYAIGSGASLTAVQGTFTLPPMIQLPNFSALAATPTVNPPLVDGVQVATCSSPGNNAPSSEYLYVTDSVNYVALEFSVDMSTGALGNPPNHTEVPTFSTGAVPSGVTVDPCNRFVYVSNTQANTISAYAICNGGPTSPTSPTQPQPCPTVPDGKLVPVTGSPYSLTGGANGPVPLVVDPFGNNLYVVETLSNQVSTFHISPVSGSLTAGTPAVVATGLEPTSIAIRADDNWLFVSNFNSATLSQYAVTPQTGELAPLEPVTTDNFPWGVAVK
jgi:6-phosphogluconolactonase (cycloisomerase 2 family)